VPGAPTIGAATATGATTATVAFTAPVSDGGATITTYTATSTPPGGSGTLSSAGSGTIPVTGLTTGTPYTFTVTATNSVGTSVASAASAAVTPTLTCATGGTCALGDIGPGGGTVFYIDMSLSAGSQFWEVGSDLGIAEWGCSGTGISGTAGNAIGTGAANTTAITSGSGCATAGIAARVASATAGWFLPSKDELNQLCKYARTQSTAVVDQAVLCNGTGTLRDGFDSGSYLSSSQINDTLVGIQVFSNGGQYSGVKNYPLRVRPVRAF